MPEHKIKESLSVLKEKEAKRPKSDKEKAAEELHLKNLEEIRNKVERWNYDKMVEKSQPKVKGLFGVESAWGEIKDYTESLGFATSFITLTFLGFILGYFIGKVALQLEEP